MLHIKPHGVWLEWLFSACFIPPVPLQRIDSPPATLSPHLTLTNSGEIYYEHARRILADLERGWRNLSATSPWSSDIKKKSAPSWIFLRNGLVLLPIGSVPGTGHAILSLETIINIRGFMLLLLLFREMFFVERTQPVDEYPHSGRQLPVLWIECRK
ncbi:Uncharacterised protein [Raoultella planticola]|uniref:Uncharacterized protein n=1 Tax=Raoultella planticola TaxID=575 RepID=A0A485CUA5_RAOPL|nr:Uncharacterised protein [Raoultella planticola]